MRLDQSSTDLFVTGPEGGKAVAAVKVSGSRRRRRLTENGDKDDQTNEASELPSARLLEFTPDSRCVIAVEPTDNAGYSVAMRQLSSGDEVWRFSPELGMFFCFLLACFKLPLCDAGDQKMKSAAL